MINILQVSCINTNELQNEKHREIQDAKRIGDEPIAKKQPV